MVGAGGRSAVRYPQITVSGVERSVVSGVAFGGTVCAPADEARPAIIHATTQRIRISINEVRIDDLPGKNHGDDHGINGRAFTVELKTVASTCLLRNAGVQKIATATIASADAPSLAIPPYLGLEKKLQSFQLVAVEVRSREDFDGTFQILARERA